MCALRMEILEHFIWNEHFWVQCMYVQLCVYTRAHIGECLLHSYISRWASADPIHSHLWNLADRMAEFLQAGCPIILDS